LDYLTVIAFALAPTVLGLTGTAAWLAYTLAVAHLLVTLATDFDLGVAHLLPAAWHGRIELAVGLLLLVAPWLLGFSDDATERNLLHGRRRGYPHRVGPDRLPRSHRGRGPQRRHAWKIALPPSRPHPGC
jgi:hypothetical protein